MKKNYLLIITIITLCILFITGCNQTPPITVIHPEIYEVEIYDNQIIQGEDLIKKFYFETQQNKELILNIKQTITLDKDKVSSEYYKENKNKYPKKFNIYIHYNKEKYIYKINDKELTYLYMKMESSKKNSDIIPSSDYKYFLTNDNEMTYDDYIHLLINSQNNTDMESKIMIIYVKSENYQFIFEESKMNSIFYHKTQNHIEITEETEKILFEYLDSLNWNTQESMTKIEKEQYESTITNYYLLS